MSLPDYTTLDTLLEHIRLRGISVSTLELQHLQTIFAAEPDLSRAELSALLCSLLAKNQQQCRTISRLFEQLIPYEKQQTDSPASASPGYAPANQPDTENNVQKSIDKAKTPRSPINIWQWGLAILFIIIVTLLLFIDKNKPEQEEEISPPEVKTALTQKEKDSSDNTATDKLKLVKNITLWTPEIITVKPPTVFLDTLPSLLLLLGAGIGFLKLLQNALLRSRKRQAKIPSIEQRGRSWLPQLKKQPAYHLLSSQSRREMGWGINHYLSDQPLTQLDIARTVTASALNGLPSLHFRNAQRQREVWLWQDRSSSNPDLSQLADEINNTLQNFNISVQRGYFHALADKVMTQQGETLWSIQHEYPENQALVVVLSDNNSLSRIGALQSEQGHKTLQLLSHWENLCIVDCSPNSGSLCQQLKAFSLECLSPREVTLWLAQQGTYQPAIETQCNSEDLHLWASACALPDRPLMEAEIRALHEYLELPCSWQYHQLTRYSRNSTSGFDFKPYRIKLLQELAQSIIVSGTEKQTFLTRIVQFWQQRYQDIDQSCLAQETRQHPWKNSSRQFRLKLDEALLGLWQSDSAQQSAETLYDLHQDKGYYSLTKDVEQQLGKYSCQGFAEAFNLTKAESQQICLPWQWQELPPAAQQQLLSAGFGGTVKTLSLHWDKLTTLLVSSLAGLTLAACIGIFINIRPLIQAQDAHIELLDNSPQPPSYFKKLMDKQLVIAHQKTGVFASVIPPDDHTVYDDYTVYLRWNKQILQAAQFPINPEAVKKTELWRLGEDKNPQRPKDWPDFSVAIIGTAADNSAARQLAARLLDSGTADQVLLGKDWDKEQQTIVDKMAKGISSQWLYINTDHYDSSHGEHIAWFNNTAQKFLNIFNKAGSHSLVNKADKTKGSPYLIVQEKTAKNSPIYLANKMILVPIPAGSFSMGSEEGSDDEKPVHRVIINKPFYMSNTEVTFQQYIAYSQQTQQAIPDDKGWGKESRPVINVTWRDVQDYTKWLSENNKQGLNCRLPSEAEWEYAARAGSTTKYFWGNDIGSNKANCRGCGSLWDGKQTAPTGSFKANDWGLYDMHGNVWEWVQDCYQDNYKNSLDNGSAIEEEKCGGRVLRGGSWYYDPVFLRSANRLNYLSDNRYYGFGFRVVCSHPSTDH